MKSRRMHSSHCQTLKQHLAGFLAHPMSHSDRRTERLYGPLAFHGERQAIVVGTNVSGDDFEFFT